MPSNILFRNNLTNLFKPLSKVLNLLKNAIYRKVVVSNAKKGNSEIVNVNIHCKLQTKKKLKEIKFKLLM